MPSMARVLRNYQITLPKPIREHFKVKEGDLIQMEETSDGLLIKPVETIDRSQSWFWSQKWQEGEKKVNREKKKGQIKSFDTLEDFLKDLHK